MHILIEVGRRTPSVDDIFDAPDAWRMLYKNLLAQGMVWELRDLVDMLVPEYGVKEALNRLLGGLQRSEDACLERLREEWDLDAYDGGPAATAFLDMLSTIFYHHVVKQTPGDRVEKYRRMGERHAAELVKQDARLAISRPYLRWMMVQLISDDYSDRMQLSNLTFTGLKRGTFMASSNFPTVSILAYRPVGDETPMWKPRFRRPNEAALATIRMIGNAAACTGDLEMQASCLQEEIWHLAEGPEAVIDKIHTLRLVAGHTKALCYLYMFKYMITHSPEARRRLRSDILALGEPNLGDDVAITRYMVLRALSTKSYEKELYLDQARRLESPSRDTQTQRDSGTTEPGQDGSGAGQNGGLPAAPRAGGIMRQSVSRTEITKDPGSARVSFEKGPPRDRKSPDSTGSVISGIPDVHVSDAVARSNQLIQIKGQMDDVDMMLGNAEYNGDAAEMSKLQQRMKRLVVQRAVLQAEGGRDGGQRAPSLDSRSRFVDLKRLEKGKSAWVEDYEGSSERDLDPGWPESPGKLDWCSFRMYE